MPAHQSSQLEKIRGNLIPNSWYKIILTDSGKPDLVSITILSEVFFKHRMGNMPSGHWKVQYSYFEAKFGFSRVQIRHSLIRLEKLGLLKREITTEVIGFCKYGGTMSLLFFEKALLKLESTNRPDKLATPPIQKSEPYNKRLNNIKEFLNQNDVDTINTDLGSFVSLKQCSELLQGICSKYPNLIFYSKKSLITYLKKALVSRGTLSMILPREGTTTSSDQGKDLPEAPLTCSTQSCNELAESSILRALRLTYGREMYISWFSKMHLESMTEGRFIFKVPTNFIRQWVTDHYLDAIYSCITSIYDLVSDIEIKA